MQFAEYTEKIRNWFKPLFTEKPLLLTTHRCCITITPSEVSLIHINKKQASAEILLTERLQYTDLDSIPLVLSGIVSKHELQNMPTYWLLHPNNYQFFVIEGMPVAAEEFRNALNWRVRSLVSYPIEDAAIDYFMIPAQRGSAENTMVATVVAQTTQLNKMVEVIERCNLNLTTIDIPELALRNLVRFYESDEKSTGFLYFFENMAILNITKQKILFFTRRLNIPPQQELSASDYEQLGLNIMRYFDYFQSEWRTPSPTRIFLAAEKLDPAIIAKKLADSLLLSIEPFSPEPMIKGTADITALKGPYLLPLGCALREEEQYVSSRD